MYVGVGYVEGWRFQAGQQLLGDRVHSVFHILWKLNVKHVVQEE